jgi:hypothetical protein
VLSHDGGFLRRIKKGFLDFLTLVDEGQCSASASKQKGKRELKNLECSINFVTRSVGSSQVKSNRALTVV